MTHPSPDVVCCLALGDAQARYHLLPLAQGLNGGVLWVVRHQRLAGPLPPNIRQVIAPVRRRSIAVLWMAWRCWRLARRANVAAIASFNPFPYGLIAAIAARLARKPFHLGWIGTDWHVRMRGRWRPVGLWLLRRASLVTVSGKSMQAAVAAAAGPLPNLSVLPHAIDLERFPITDESQAAYDLVFVGRLVPVKRVDVLLQAAALLLPHFPRLRVAIAGEGPAAADLRRQAEELHLGGAVEFLGMLADVAPLLQRSRVFVLCSASEGLPFALIEAMCSGVIPVATPVGDIPSVIESGVNGFLTPVGDAAALAAALARVLDDRELRASLRRRLVAQRDQWEFARAAAVWRDWLTAATKRNDREGGDLQSAAPGDRRRGDSAAHVLTISDEVAN